MDQLNSWLAAVRDLPDYNAFCLSTIGADGFPQSRIVLLRESDPDGLVFYTNYQSEKGREIMANPNVGMTFFWPQLERQLRISGQAEVISPESSDAYFASRPRASQIGAWCSPQSKEIESRSELDARVTEYELQFEGKAVPRPPHWGGFKINPHRFEFWQGRASRLHDRIVYEWKDGRWEKKRIAP